MNVGVDESNHGRYPEIFVASFSSDPKYIKTGCFAKQRRKTKRSFRDIPFIYTSLTQKGMKGIHQKDYMIVAASEFIKYINNIEEVNKVFIDGTLTSRQIDVIKYVIGDYNIKTKIYAQKEYDKTNCLVNEADNIANYLFRHFQKPKKEQEDFSDKLVKVNLEDYVDYLL